MPFRLCPSGCGHFLSVDDGHDRCLQCLGIQHAEDAFVDDSCACCGCMSMISLRSRLTFLKILAPSAATRAGLSASRGSPADTPGDLRVTVRASPPVTPPRTSYSSCSEHPIWFPGDFAGPSHGASSISFGAPSVDRMSIAASGDGFTSSEDEGAVELLRPRLNRHLRSPHPTQAPNRPGSRRSGRDVGNPEMLEFALSQEMARTAPLLPWWRAGRRIFCFSLFLFGTHLLKGRAISFSSGFSGPWDDSVRRPASSLSPTTHFASSQQSMVWGRYSSPRTSGLGPREFGEDASERTAFCTIHPYSLSLHHHRYVDCAVGDACTVSGSVAYAAQPVSLAHAHNSTWLRDSSQVQQRSRDVSGSPERPFLARGDCCPPGKGCNRAGASSRDEAGVLQHLLHRTQERWWPLANPGSASFEPGFTQAPVQDADAQAHDQMHSAPGLVCSDRPEGRLPSRFDPSATQTVPTVCVRRSGMAVQGPPLRAIPVSPCVHKGRRRRPYPVREVGVGILNYLDDWLILAQSKEQLGLRVNWEKSKLSPVQRISFLNVELDSVSMMARLTEERAQAVLNCLSSFRGSNVVPLKQFQRLLGHMASAAAVTPLGLLHMRPLQHWLPEVGMALRYTASLRGSAPYGTRVQIYGTSMCGSWTGRGRLERSTTSSGRDHHSG